ncbi:Cobalt-zinc-cadmium resistance protein CzcA; Cation efflux system protein CusA, partial [hydrothermal vent metagenome]
TKLPIDAVPDITNNQVQINTVDPSLAPLDIERLVTYPVETSLAGIPGLETTRSISRNGFSQVTAIFADDVDIYFARQQVGERLTTIGDALPASAEPSMGPVSTGLGEVLMWTVSYAPPKKGETKPGRGLQADGSYLTPEGERLTSEVAKAAYLRTLQDWVIGPQLRNVPGVAGVDSIGGYARQFVVTPSPAKLAAYGIGFDDLSEALESINLSVGANFVERGGEAFLVRADARIRTIEEIENAIIDRREGIPVHVRDVANVGNGGDLRTGAATENGEEVVVGTALMLLGENSRAVAASTGERLMEIAKTMPTDVKLEIVLDRSKLVNATISTVQTNLTEGALLVIVALFLLLGNFRAALITALVIPLSFLMMAIGMNRLGVSGNLMSLGALDFGLIVDGSVIIVENFLRRMAGRQHSEGRLLTLGERLEEVIASTREMIRPSLFGQAIILLVFVPLLTFQGVEGKTFSPMAITVMLALGGAFILSLTLVPALLALLIRGKVAEKEVRAVSWTKSRYEPALRKALARPVRAITAGFAVFALSLVAFTFVGSEFMPQLDEQDLSLQAIRIPSTSLRQSVEMQKQIEKEISKFPQVRFMYSKTGTAEVASDPMPPNISDAFIILRPKDEWPNPALSKTALVEEMEEALSKLIGNNFEFSQPIQMRFNELIAGVRGDVAVKVFGDDLDQLTATANQLATIFSGMEGSADVRVEQTAGFPALDVQFDRAAIAAHGLTVDEVARTVGVALGGTESGIVFQGDRRFDIVVRLAGDIRSDIDAIGALPIILPENALGQRSSVPLRSLATLSETEGLNQISREDGKRRVVVQLNVRGRDVGSLVTEAKELIEDQVGLPAGVYLQWGGQFENLQAANARIALVVPIIALLVFGLLAMALGNIRMAIAVFTTVPLGIAGGIFSLIVTGLPFSISVAVGFIVLAGVAVLNGLVMMTSIQGRLNEDIPLVEAIYEGAVERFRSVLMTAIVPSLGFVPMAIATGTGAEVQKPLAIVVIGGLITATILTLFVLPAVTRLILENDGPDWSAHKNRVKTWIANRSIVRRFARPAME